MKKLLISGIIFLLFSLDVKAEIKPLVPKDIVETTPIEPNIVTLLKDEVRYTANWDANTSDSTIEITYQDAQLLMMVAQAEGGNQQKSGMKRIMEVILNRVNDPMFPDTVQEVVYQSGQFESVTNGSIYQVEISAECHEALAELEKNKDNDKQIIAFETSVNGRTLSKFFDYSYTEKDHDFYITKKD